MLVIKTENFDPVAISEQQFDHAVCYMKELKKGLIQFLKKPKRINIAILTFSEKMEKEWGGY
jgi:hypothetical protein